MSQNFVKSGDTITVTAPRALVSGDGFLVGSLFGVAGYTAAINTEVEMHTEGVFTLPKTSALAISVGDPLYWDNTNFVVNKTSSGTLVGVAHTAAANPSATVEVRLNSGYYPALDVGVLQTVDVTVTSAQILALHTTPITVVAAPGAGLANVLVYVHAMLDYNSAAYAAIAAGDDLEFRYTNASGGLLLSMETTGFLDQTSDQLRYSSAPAPATNAAVTAGQAITPVANALICIDLIGAITTGDSPLKLRIGYRTLPTQL